MAQKEYEMPDEYKRNLAHLAQFLEDRERFAKGMVDVPAHLMDDARAQLRKFDDVIDALEKSLAEEYGRHQSEKAREAEITESVDKGWEASKRIYILIKHQTPHLLESFTKQVLDPMDEDLREEFLDAVAVLETTKLDAILKGED